MSDEQIPASSDEKRELYEFIPMLMTPPPYMVFRNELQRKEFTPRKFVSLVADLFRQMEGNDVVVTLGAAGPDEAIDILCKTAKGDYIIQCKKWKAKVGVPVVREVYGAAVQHQAKGAVIVTVSSFTDMAVNFTIDVRSPAGRNIDGEELFDPINPPVGLIDGKELFDLMNQHMPTVVADILKKAAERRENDS